MKKIVFLLLILFQSGLIFSQTTFTQMVEKDIITLKKQIKTQNALIASMSCNFTQTKKMSVLKQPAISTGSMYYKKASQFRWEYTNNPVFIFAQNGKTIYTKSNDKVTVVKDNSAKLYEEISKIVMASINGSLLDNPKEFDIKYWETKNSVKIILTPRNRNMKKFIATIELIIDKKTYQASQFSLFDPSGDSTIITFEKVKINPVLEDSLFILK
jgi:outer membrane lipoprotein carrier protein